MVSVVSFVKALLKAGMGWIQLTGFRLGWAGHGWAPGPLYGLGPAAASSVLCTLAANDALCGLEQSLQTGSVDLRQWQPAWHRVRLSMAVCAGRHGTVLR